MATHDPKTIMIGYIEAYEKLYKRQPTGLRALDREWVLVNGARMRIVELEKLTYQLTLEYGQLQEKKSMVSRLIKWFRG
ncbi:MAG: hypothetical protein KC546_19170 [Anaerolineae bacterium]|nr:hypothetical protein [Anaerolineae bacterium]MCA9890514.1 hypothetical protein [Anaerolineae bacterium]MCA9894868.1 hypothetical protein [Anaerolineae bacterium]MCB9459505.1 hypothetical protein [Anaerolineaceae bacterium]